ncbi:galectin-4-like [Erythrolamprus reginae]|uniref:galectin-4-like n=1 Tax=Erythrolamprus reginae TaxID=121349 RepID=UPI00396CC3D2
MLVPYHKILTTPLKTHFCQQVLGYRIFDILPCPMNECGIIQLNGLNGKEIEELMSIFTDGGEVKTALPYRHPVPGGLHPGMAVYLQGTVAKYPKSFWVKFPCGKDGTSDVSLYFNPLFKEGRINLWTYLAQKWGNQEHHKMPLQKGEHFEIFFIVYHTGYQILVNGKPFCRYSHRIPPERVEEIYVDGDLELQSLTAMGGRMMGNMILVNRKPFCSFKHRIPPESVQVITVAGDLELQSLTVMRGPMMGNTNEDLADNLSSSLTDMTSQEVCGGCTQPPASSVTTLEVGHMYFLH